MSCWSGSAVNSDPLIYTLGLPKDSWKMDIIDKAEEIAFKSDSAIKLSLRYWTLLCVLREVAFI